MRRLWISAWLLAACGPAAPLLPGDAGSRDAGPGDAGAPLGPADVFVPPTPERAVELSIASWNLENFPRHDQTTAEVARLIEAHDLDLIGVQEITDRDAFDALDEALSDHEAVISFRGWQRVGFLYRTDRIEVSDIDLLWTDDRWAFPRPALTAEITVLDDAQRAAFDFAFMVVHLKAMVDDESRARRALAVQALEGWMRERGETEPEIVIVGDFNDELLDPPEWNVYGPLLDAPERYTFLTLPNERAGQYSYISFEKMIDHVLVSEGARTLYGLGETEVLPLDREVGGYREVVSDHLPVVSRFRAPR